MKRWQVTIVYTASEEPLFEEWARVAEIYVEGLGEGGEVEEVRASDLGEVEDEDEGDYGS